MAALHYIFRELELLTACLLCILGAVFVDVAFVIAGLLFLGLYRLQKIVDAAEKANTLYMIQCAMFQCVTGIRSAQSNKEEKHDD